MPYALIIAGIVLTVAGVRNTESALFNLLKNDFTGSNSFIWWSASILAIGAVGYVPDLRKLANAFLALLLIVLILAQNKNGNNLFKAFNNALSNIGNTPAPTPANDQQASANTSALSNAANTLASVGQSLAQSLAVG